MKSHDIRIKLSKSQTGVDISGEGAKLSCYIIENTDSKPDLRRPAVVICPGGAYQMCSSREGDPVAMQFLAMGCHAFVLNYSVAPNTFPTALLELAHAVSIIRNFSREWKVDTNKIIVCGFSAGGHLAAGLGVFWDKSFVCEPLNLAGEDIRPNGLILAYPVITSGKYTHRYSIESLLGGCASDPGMRELMSLEKQVGGQVPPVFLWHTYTDASVPAENSLLFAAALRESGVSLELHIFPEGRHGLSLAGEETDKPGEEGYIVPQCQEWIRLAGNWIKFLQA